MYPETYPVAVAPMGCEETVRSPHDEAASKSRAGDGDVTAAG